MCFEPASLYLPRASEGTSLVDDLIGAEELVAILFTEERRIDIQAKQDWLNANGIDYHEFMHFMKAVALNITSRGYHKDSELPPELYAVGLLSTGFEYGFRLTMHLEERTKNV